MPPVTPLRLCRAAGPPCGSAPASSARSGPRMPRESVTMTSPTPAREQDPCHGDARGTGPGDDDRQVAERFSTTLTALQQGSQGHDRGAVLVVVEDRDVEPLLEPSLDLEAPRGRDVLEVDAAVRRGDAGDGLDDLVDGAGLHAHRHGVDVGEVLEEDRLALHDGHRRERADVPEPEHRRAVADDGHGVAAARVDVGEGRVDGDGPGDVGDAGRVEQGRGRLRRAAPTWRVRRACRPRGRRRPDRSGSKS